jgi:hypothetical protein
MAEFNFINDVVIAQAAKNLKEYGFLTPVAFLMVNGLPYAIIPLFYNNDEEKNMLFYKIGITMKEKGASEVLIVNDAAMRDIKGVSSEQVEALSHDPTESPLCYPESMRTEIIAIFQYNIVEDKKIIHYQEYKKINKEIELGQIVMYDVNISGNIFEIINKGYYENNC